MLLWHTFSHVNGKIIFTIILWKVRYSPFLCKLVKETPVFLIQNYILNGENLRQRPTFHKATNSRVAEMEAMAGESHIVRSIYCSCVFQRLLYLIFELRNWEEKQQQGVAGPILIISYSDKMEVMLEHCCFFTRWVQQARSHISLCFLHCRKYLWYFVSHLGHFSL